MVFDVGFFIGLLPIMLKYVRVTFALSLLALCFGTILAVFIALVIHMNVRILKPIVKVWVSFFRGTPLVAQLFFFYFGMIQLFPQMKGMSAFTAAVIGLSFNTSAYMSETLRGAILSVDKGQMEGCLSIGMTYFQAMRRVVVPQAIRVAIPALSNSFCDIIKGSSLAFTLGVTEIMAAAQMEGASSYRFLEAFTAVILMYWAIISCFSRLQKVLEIRLNRSY